MFASFISWWSNWFKNASVLTKCYSTILGRWLLQFSVGTVWLNTPQRLCLSHVIVKLFMCWLIFSVNVQQCKRGFLLQLLTWNVVIFQGKDEIRCTIQNVTAGFYCVLVSHLQWMWISLRLVWAFYYITLLRTEWSVLPYVLRHYL
jgi:hypothetical protein